jgi:hypothetical protein
MKDNLENPEDIPGRTNNENNDCGNAKRYKKNLNLIYGITYQF